MCSFYLFCNWFIYILFLLFLIGGSFLCIFSYSYPDSFLYNEYYNDGLIKINETYHYLSEYPHINKLIKEYSSMIIKYNDISFDCCYHYYLIPAFSILAVIFSFSFMVFKKDRFIFISLEILLFIIKGIAILDTFLYYKKLKSLLYIEKDKNYGKIEEKLYSYEEMINNGDLSGINLVILIIEFILLIIFLCINNNNKIESDKKSKSQSIIIYILFGFFLFMIFNFYEMNIVDCKKNISYTCNSNYVEINRTYMIINNIKIYLSQRRDDYHEELYTIFIYYYNDYPILEKICKIYKKILKK